MRRSSAIASHLTSTHLTSLTNPPRQQSPRARSPPPPPPPKMITRFITDVTTKFNPFSPRAKPARLFLSFLPPNARASGMSITTQLLAKSSAEPASLTVKFKDGKEMKLDCDKLGIKGLIEEVDRHSRALQKQADLASG
ncbi:uncharacterized protein E0L32_000605 [Thyridium curvatum]|uniref:Large ribosomal subunit protein mL53 n=1 Tax=Thyridium curvatum TaxID=1093900 RepID=A0A507BAU4_9PEZI|nr:uncharacterized protein E0L32_000605 [Thyridium curvatum]TPX14211.1 hypothetical protein E0L32_000605 [Thyridium curvatum]